MMTETPLIKLPIEQVQFAFHSHYAQPCAWCSEFTQNTYQPITKGWRPIIFACHLTHAMKAWRKKQLAKEKEATDEL